MGCDLCALLGRSGFLTLGRLDPTLFCGALHLLSTACLWFDERCFKTSVGVRVGHDLCAVLGRSGCGMVGRLHPTLFCGALHLFLWIAPEVRRDVGTLSVVLFHLCLQSKHCPKWAVLRLSTKCYPIGKHLQI